MIEIIIPYWWGAGLVFVAMCVSISLIVAGGLIRKYDVAVVGMLLLICIDVITAGLSSVYMATPTNSPCVDDLRPSHVWNIPSCTYPTVNPYEQQPIHPILWIHGAITWIFNGLGGAISIKTGVI